MTKLEELQADLARRHKLKPFTIGDFSKLVEGVREIEIRYDAKLSLLEQRVTQVLDELKKSSSKSTKSGDKP